MTTLDEWLRAIRGGDAARVREAVEVESSVLHMYLPVLPPAMGVEVEQLWLPLHVAVWEGAVEVVRESLALGAAADSRTRHRTPMHARATPLHLAADTPADDDTASAMTRLLLDREATADVRDAAGRSPLHRAARRGRGGVARMLLAAGAMVDARDAQGRTPLHAALLGPSDNAAASGDVSATLRALLDAGADVDARCPRDPEGYTPLHHCVASAGLKPATRLAAAEQLMRAGADPTLRDPRHDRSPRGLAEARRASGVEGLDALIELLTPPTGTSEDTPPE